MAAARAKLCVACWKHITCSYCGCEYRRRVSSTKLGKGATQEEADTHATEAAVKYLRRRVDVWPCPYCGNQQPEMVGSLRFTALFLLLIASFTWAAPLALEYTGLVPRSVAVLLLILFSALLIAALSWIITRYPNNSAAANKMRATNMIRLMQVWVDRGPNRKDGDWDWPASIAPGKPFWPLVIAFVFSLMLFATSDMLRWSQGWPANSGWRPEVVGPGDSAWVFLPTTIQSLKGYWTGNASALLEVEDAPGVFVPIRATTRVDEWGHTIQVNQGESNATRNLWVRLHLPDDPKLAGKRVRVHVAINVAYPVLDWNQREFRVRQDGFQHQEDLQLAPVRAGTTFWTAWYAGTLLPFAALMVLQLYCVGRAYRLKHSGGSARVVPCNQPQPETSDDDDFRDVPPAPKKDTSIREDGYGRRSSEDGS